MRFVFFQAISEVTELSDKVQKCGLCGCGSDKCYSISVKESQAAIDVVKQACVEAIEKVSVREDHYIKMGYEFKREAIDAVRSVK